MNRKTTVFFLPLRFPSYDAFVTETEKKGQWERTEEERIRPRYLFHYASRIGTDRRLFSSFSFRELSALGLFEYSDYLKEDSAAELTELRLSCFSTGIGFLEFWVDCSRLSLDEMANFAYAFKKVYKKSAAGKSVLQLARLLIGERSAQLFFADSAEFKYECICYHFIQTEQGALTEPELKKYLTLLKRNYKTSFAAPPADSEYDTFYSPYSYDHWAGSPEGLVNIAYLTGEKETDYFIENFKPGHQSVDYYFMFLLLLNQRYSAIEYIDEIARGDTECQGEMEALNRRIVTLKSVFSFTVISGDHIFQNLYSRMCRVMDVERLLEDIRDNENQMEIVRNARAEKVDRLSNRFLFGLSLLSLFSALVDAAGYFDRFEALRPFATWLGLGCTLAVVVICLIWLFRKKR